METEIKRRLKILNEIKTPVTTARLLRGGMQKRLHRQEAIRYGQNIRSQKTKLQNKLSLIEQQKQSEENVNVFQTSNIELEEFNEPVFRRIRNRRGFF